MSLFAALLIRYSVPIGKAIYALASGQHSELNDLFLDPTKDWLGKRAQDVETKNLVERVRKKVMRELEKSLHYAGDDINIEAVVQAAEETFQAGFSFESLVENYNTPELIAEQWRVKRSHFSSKDDVFV